jgi:hypothetical protein
MAYQKKQVFTSPKGVFRYPALDKPDYGNEQFPKPNGEYKVQLVVSPDVADELLKKIQPLFDQAVTEGEELFAKLPIASRKKLGELTVNDLVSVIYDKETEEPTGEVFFKFSTAASGVNAKKEKWTRKIALFDAKGKPIAKAPAIWGGTVGKVSFEAAPYFVPGTGTAGLKLYLTAAQIIDLVAGGSRGASEFGFGEEEGYEGSSTPEGSFGDESEPDMPPAANGDEDF